MSLKEMSPLSLLQKYKKILTYLLCSVITALLELVIGWLLLQVLPRQIIVVNTIGILCGAVAHYFLTLLLVFEKQSNYKSILAYAVTFFFGILLQNFIIWAFYDHLLAGMGELLRYAISKGMSLAVPFFLLYHIRTILNKKIKD